MSKRTELQSSNTPPAPRGGRFLPDLLADVRHSFRQYGATPGFTIVALLTIALGIGANAAMFSIVNGILLRPLPFAEPQQLVLLHQANERTGERMGNVSFEDLEDWRARSRSLTDVAGYADMPVILMGRGDAREVEMTYVTHAFFDVLRVPMLLGRPLQEEDFRERARSAVVSYRFWKDIFGGEGNVIGSSITLTGQPYTIVGVMPPDVRHPTPDASVWVPQVLVEPNMYSNGPPTRSDRYLRAIGRLASGSDAETAQRELSGIAVQLAGEHPESNADHTSTVVVPLHTAVTGDVDQALLIVLGVVGFILLIGCANLANLMLARGSGRAREFAIRAALGAGHARIIRQLLTESIVLAFVGGAIGLLISVWGVHAILALSAETLPRVEDVRLDTSVIGFSMLLMLITGLLFGLAPAYRLARIDPNDDLRGGRGSIGASGGRLRGGLVVAEVALAVLLVTGAGLMARSFLQLRSVDPGFRPEQVLTVTMQLNLTGVPDQEMGSFLVNRREEILTGVRALPGVQSAGMINVFPLRDNLTFAMEYTRGGAAPAAGETGVLADTRYVDQGYLDAMGIPLLRGERLPSELTGPLAPVLMSESAARALWPDGDAVGRTINVPWGEALVVGVVGDVRQVGLSQAPQPAVYFTQLIAPRLMATLVVRAAGDPMNLAGPIRQVIRDIDPNQPIRSVTPMTEVLSESLARDRFFTVLFLTFGGLALLLAAVGIYGVLSYMVRQRTQEIGVRMALGASTADVLRMVATGGMKLVALGAVAGSASALALSRLLESQLYGVTATDPLAFAGGITALFMIALAATYVPARRAMRVPPMTALRPD